MAKRNQQQQPDDEQDMKQFSIRINEFGQIETTVNIDKLNAFLNENVDDKKFRDKEDKDKDASEDIPE